MIGSFFEALHPRVSEVLEALEAVGWMLDLAVTDPDRAEETESQCASCHVVLTRAREATEALLLCFPDTLRAHEMQMKALVKAEGCSLSASGGSISCQEDGATQERPSPHREHLETLATETWTDKLAEVSKEKR